MSRRAKDRIVFTMNIVPGGMRPATIFDEELLGQYRPGSQVEVTIHQGKSLPMLKTYWGFLLFIVDATQRWPTKEAASAALLTQLGYFASYTALMGGSVITVPASIGEMEERTFNEYCRSAFEIIEDELGITVEDYKAFLRSKTGA